MSTPDLVGVLSDTMPVLGEKLEAADRLAGGYARRYAHWFLTSKSQRRYPFPPSGLDANIAKLVRDEVQEAALVRRAGAAA
jgi:hypothetical protein